MQDTSKSTKKEKTRLIPVNASKYVKTLQLEGWHQLTQTQNSSKFVELDGFCQLMLQNASAFLKQIWFIPTNTD